MFWTKTSAMAGRGPLRPNGITPLTSPLLAVLLLAFGPTELLADDLTQSVVSLENAGRSEPVRIKLDDGKTIVGRVVKIDDEALTIRRPSGGVRRLPLETITSLNIKGDDGKLLQGEIVRMANDGIGWRAHSASPPDIELASKDAVGTVELGGPLIRLDGEEEEQPPISQESAATELAALQIEDGTTEAAVTKPEPVQLQVRADDVGEGDEVASFELTLSEPAPRSILVIYTVLSGTAVSPDDYTHQQGTVVFAPGETEATIAVPITDDESPEETESFKVFVSGDPAAVVIEQRSVTMTIADDDG